MIRQSRLYQVGSRPSSDMAEILCNPSWAHGGQSPFAPRGQQSSVITNGCLFMFQIHADMSARVDSVTSRGSYAKNRVPQRFGGWQFRWNLSWQNFPTFPLESFMSRLYNMFRQVISYLITGMVKMTEQALMENKRTRQQEFNCLLQPSSTWKNLIKF